MSKGKKFLLVFVMVNLFVLIIMFSSATWSWLSVGITTDTNTISSSHFTFDMKVVNKSTQEEVLVTLSTQNNHDYIVNFDKTGTYTVTITIPNTSTALNGYCKIFANNNETTQVYYKNIVSNGEPDKLSFDIVINTVSQVTFIPSIGICTQNSFELNEGLVIEFTEIKND